MRFDIKAFTEKHMRRNFAIGILIAALAIACSAQLLAQDSAHDHWREVLIPDGETVYDVVNHVTWLAEVNLAGQTFQDGGDFRFGIPLCPPLTVEPIEPCVNASGSMNYTSAVAWVAAMNSVNYLGHSDWQLPTAPLKDPDCSSNGPAPYREGFAFGCDTGALGYLYYDALGIKAPDSAIPIPPNMVGPFRNFQPNLYWSGSGGGGLTCTIANFSFGSGAQGGGCGGDFADVLPMIPGEVLGMPIPGGSKLYVNPGDKTVYDPGTNSTWLANANLAKRETFGLPRCKTAPDTTPCVARDGSMNYESAMAWVNDMNAWVDPVTHVAGYLGQTNWQLPTLDASCPTYGCGGERNPMGNLYYDQLKIPAGTPVVAVPDKPVGPFQNLQPFPYWSCLADTIQEPCQPAIDGGRTDEPSANSEWGFSFVTGFLGTERVTANHFVTVYHVDPTPTKPPIPPKCPPTDPGCYQ
jgi:hypothetical protein